MINSSALYAGILLFGVFISALSQILLKKAAGRTYKSVIFEYLNPAVIIAYLIFFGSTFLAILAYKGIPLSMGPVLESTSYIYATIFGAMFFKERVTKRKVIGLTLILIGIAVFACY